MNHETIVSVDEATKKFMGFINEEISANINDGINGALRKTNNDLAEMTEKANALLASAKSTSKTVENLPSVIEQTLKNTEQIILRESLKNHQLHKEINEGTKTVILTEQKLAIEEIAKMNETYSKNQKEILAKILAFEEKLSIVNAAMEGQALVFKRLERIEEKINYLNLPFYKRWFNKGVE